MSAQVGNTLTVGDSWRDKEEGETVQSFLCLVLQCSDLAAPVARFALGGINSVRLGRGEGHHQRSGSELTIRIPDQWMSSRHAQIQQSFGRWVVEDAGSKNGTAVNGVGTKRAVLRDGDLITVGHTVLMYREAKCRPGAVLDVEFRPGEPQDGLATVCPEYEVLTRDIHRVAASDVRVLLLGESGTGKEVLARAVHALSKRSGAFVAVNCGALPVHLVESELFGHKKGAFSGADSDRPGLVRTADGGTLFLDEIGDLPSSSQAALLRVLQEGEVTPIGAAKPIKVDVRLVAATHRDIDGMVKRGQFRHDLYARIAGFRVTLPALRNRREDIGMLTSQFLQNRSGGKNSGIELEAVEQLIRFPWPLNIRELESTISTAYVLAAGEAIASKHLPVAVQTGKAKVGDNGGSVNTADRSTPALSPEDQKIRAELIDKLRQHAGNVSAVARAMGKDRKQVQRWIKRFQVDAAQFR